MVPPDDAAKNDAAARQQTSQTDSSSERGSEAQYQPDRGDQVALGQGSPLSRLGEDAPASPS